MKRDLLEGIDVVKSPYLEELREKVRVVARAEGKVEGKAEALHDTVLQLGRLRFSKAPSRKQKAQLQAVTDAARLERIRNRLLDATSWDDLLATP